MQDLTTNTSGNGYDNLKVDVVALYDKYLVADSGVWGVKQVWSRGVFGKIYGLFVIPLKYRNYVWYLLRRSQVDQCWFEIFKGYWMEIIGGRPLWGPQDLYFLRGLYRIDFQKSEVQDNVSANTHEDVWQKPEVVYQLIHLVYKESVVNEMRMVELLRKFVPGWKKMLEFGCGTAPIAFTLAEFGQIKHKKVYISDIATAAFHYAAYRFAPFKNVEPVLLMADNNFMLGLKEKVDVIFCITVLEHLGNPLETVRNLSKHLNPGGILIFDYVKGDGFGLDTAAGVRERGEVLKYIRDKYDILHGRLSADKNMDVTVARLKSG